MIVARFIGLFIIVDVMTALLVVRYEGWLLNTQVAFLCALFIVLSTFFSYKGILDKDAKESSFIPTEPTRDEEEELKEEKRGVKASFENLFKSYKGALSLFRLGAYGLLCVSVIYLIKHDYFHPIAFMVGLSIIPLSLMFAAVKGVK